MTQLDDMYLSILKSGIVAIRNSLSVGDAEWAQLEAEHLHEIPSLIADANNNRHHYYLNQTVALYLEAIKKRNRMDIARHAHAAYFAVWDRMREMLKK